jgi:hypothetical protein
MSDLFASGRIVDVALGVIVLELAALLVFRQRLAPGLKPLDLIGQLSAGFMLLLGVRCAVGGVDYRVTLALLAASFPAHLFDLSRRARRTAEP